MPYDPSLPANGTKAIAAQMRGQLGGLKSLIDAVPTIISVVVDAVNTLPVGSPATVDANIIASVLHLVFGIPLGAPLGGVAVDAVSTLNPGDPATANVTFDGVIVRFGFGIPRGADGPTGADGAPGAPGEVTTAALDTAINSALVTAADNSSANTNAVPTLALPFINDPPTLADIELVRMKVNELITALRR